MSTEDQIRWVTVTLNFSPEEEAGLEKQASDAGLSLKCYCVHILHKHLLDGASAVQQEQWQRYFPASLLRNGCRETLLTGIPKASGT